MAPEIAPEMDLYDLEKIRFYELLVAEKKQREAKKAASLASGAGAEITAAHDSSDSASEVAPLATDLKRPSNQASKSRKRVKKSSEATSSEASPVPEVASLDIEHPSPPKWYTEFTKAQVSRGNRPSVALQNLKDAITSCGKVVGEIPSSKLEKLNDAIHQAFFLKLEPVMIRKAFLMQNDTGLPQVFSTQYPWYIREDAAELYTKWWSGDFDPDLFRGVKLGTKKNAKAGRESVADKLDAKYNKRRHANFHGNGHLRNGQWWPNQLCAVRDGAHASHIAGICGQKGEGAWSCVMSQGSYQNKDNGDEVWYHGTESKVAGEPTDSTQRMLENVANGQPVRLLRTSKATTVGLHQIRPSEGIRYDGLYKVEGFEIKNFSKQVHLFHLVRLPDQGTIRWEGPEVRPTKEEVFQLEKARKEKAFFVTTC